MTECLTNLSTRCHLIEKSNITIETAELNKKYSQYELAFCNCGSKPFSPLPPTFQSDAICHKVLFFFRFFFWFILENSIFRYNSIARGKWNSNRWLKSLRTPPSHIAITQWNYKKQQHTDHIYNLTKQYANKLTLIL